VFTASGTHDGPPAYVSREEGMRKVRELEERTKKEYTVHVQRATVMPVSVL